MIKHTSRSGKTSTTRVINAPSDTRPAADDPPPRGEPDQPDRLIQEMAYYIAQERGFLPGYELEDWLAAEARINAASE